MSSADRKVVVVCGAVKLKLTLTPELLAKPLVDACIAPYLAAYSKKVGSTLTPAGLASVEVSEAGSDVREVVPDMGVIASSVLTTELCTLLLVPRPRDEAGPVKAVSELLALPAGAAADEARKALHEVRELSRDEAHKDALLAKPRLYALAAEHACLSAAAPGSEWTVASSEAAVLLYNVLVMETDKVGRALVAPPIDALRKLADAFAAAESLPLVRLRLLGSIAFRLSLVVNAAAPEAAAALASGCTTALSWVVGVLNTADGAADGERADEAAHASLAADLVRTLFNLLRASPPDGATDAGRERIASLVSAAGGLLRAGCERKTGDPAETEELSEAKAVCLQLGMVLPKGCLSSHWEDVAAMLPPILKRIEAGADGAHQPLALPCVILQGICEVDAAARDGLKRHVFEAEVLAAELDDSDPYRPAGEAEGYDPNLPLAEDASLRRHLLKNLCSNNYLCKRVVGDFLFALCGDDATEFVRLSGLGSAAAVLQERNLLQAFQSLGGQ